jgi:glycerol uptake facilitator-like aquaporin
MLAIIQLVGIPLTGTSVNPARSLGPALFAGGESLKHVWVFCSRRWSAASSRQRCSRGCTPHEGEGRP